MNNKIWSKILLMGLILSTFTVAFSVSAAPGDGFANAITITPGDTTGTLPGPSDALSWYYTFAVVAGQDIVVSLEGPEGTDFDLTLYDPDKTIMVGTTSGEYPKTVEQFAVSSGGGWYIEVTPTAEQGSGEFTLSLILGDRPKDGPGSSFAKAIEIAPGPTAGALPGAAADGSNYYKFTVVSGQTIVATLLGADRSDFNLLLHGTRQNLLESSTLRVYPESVSYEDAAGGTYYLQVTLVAGFGDFALFLALAEYSGPGSSAGEALPIREGAFEAELPGPSPTSGIWYTFEVTEGQDIYLELVASMDDGDFGLSLYNPDQKLLGSTTGDDYPRRLNHFSAAAGAYFVEVIPFGGSGMFTLSLRLVDPAERIPGTDFENAIPIKPGETAGGLPGPSEHNGLLYVLSADESQLIGLSLTGSADTEFEMNLYGPDHTFLGASRGSSYPHILEYITRESGSYFVEVIPLMGEGDFRFTLGLETITLPGTTPTIVKTTTPSETTQPKTTTPPETTRSETPPPDSTTDDEGGPSPGFEFISVLFAIPFLMWIRRRRQKR